MIQSIIRRFFVPVTNHVNSLQDGRLLVTFHHAKGDG